MAYIAWSGGARGKAHLCVGIPAAPPCVCVCVFIMRKKDRRYTSLHRIWKVFTRVDKSSLSLSISEGCEKII